MRSSTRRNIAVGVLAGFLAAEIAAVATVTLVSTTPAAAQFFDDRFFGGRPSPPRRVPQQPPPQQSFPFFGGWAPFQPQPPVQHAPQHRQAPAEATRPPAPRKPDGQPTTNVVVFGDSMAEWLAYGLEDAFSETPEVGVVRKHRLGSSLIRNEQRSDSYDWAQAAKEILAAEKPSYIVMMIGLGDRQAIRERPRAAPAKPAGQQPPAPGGTAQPAAPAQPGAAADAEAPAVAADEAPAPQPTPAPTGPVATYEFRSEKWAEAYGKRLDEVIGVLKSKGVPVFWVGLPPIRGNKSTADMVYLNELFKARAEKAGIIYVDVFDGFADDGGDYSPYGPDVNGQNRRLRTGDGVNFTKAGARKLAHYGEREIKRIMQAKTTPMALPTQEEPVREAPKPGGPAPRPVAGPVVPLSGPIAETGGLIGGGPSRVPVPDPVASRVLVKGEPVAAPSGRADDFSWNGGNSAAETAIIEPVATQPTPAVVRPAAPVAPAAATPPPRNNPTRPAARTTQQAR